MIKLKYDAPKGRRTNRGFLWVTGAPLDYWWSHDDKRWMLSDEIKGAFSSCATCKTVKAFKRMIRKNPILQHCSPVLVHRYHIVDDKGKHLYNLDVSALNE